MKKIIIILGLIIAVSQISQSQWVSNYSGNFSEGNSSGNNRIANSKGLVNTVDNAGNCYVAGYSFCELTGNDIVVIKYSPQGDTIWSRIYNGSGNSDDKAFGIACDAAGNVYVTGYASITGQGLDIILLKYNASGTLQWVRTYSGNDNGEDKAFGIAIDAAGNIYVTGYITGEEEDSDIITIKYNPGGARIWAKIYRGHKDRNDKAFGIATDYLNNIYVTGYTELRSGNRDIITIKYNSSGQKIWDKRYNNQGAKREDQGNKIATDASGNIYVAGYMSTNTNNVNSIVLKYSTTGNLLWSRTYNGQGNSEDKAFGIAVDGVGDIYITGFTTGITSGEDYLTIKYNSAGVQQWVSFYNGIGNGNDEANAIALANGSVIVTGKSWGNNDDDFATVTYLCSNGNELQVSRYSFAVNSEDVAKDVAVNSQNNFVYVTGYSELIINGPSSPSYISTQMIPMGEKIEITNTLQIPDNFALHQNYPNPFNPTTVIKYDIVKSSNVKLAIYDVEGRKVATLVDGYVTAGKYEAVFSSTGLSSGVYFYVLTAGEFRDVKKMTLVK